MDSLERIERAFSLGLCLFTYLRMVTQDMFHSFGATAAMLVEEVAEKVNSRAVIENYLPRAEGTLPREWLARRSNDIWMSCRTSAISQRSDAPTVDLCADLAGLEPVWIVPFFDEVRFRMAREPSKAAKAKLREYTNSFDIRRGKPIRDSNDALLLTIVNARPEAYGLLADLGGYTTNYVEIALDWIFSDSAVPVELRLFFDLHFVQPWWRRRIARLDQRSRREDQDSYPRTLYREANGTYTGQRGHKKPTCAIGAAGRSNEEAEGKGQLALSCEWLILIRDRPPRGRRS